jgi:hypothetical protein
MRQKTKKKVPRVPNHDTRGRGLLPRVLEQGSQGRFFSNSSVRGHRQMQIYSYECRSSRVLCSGKMTFPECNSFSSTTLGEVSGFWHSGNFASPVVDTCSGYLADWTLQSQSVILSRMFDGDWQCVEKGNEGALRRGIATWTCMLNHSRGFTIVSWRDRLSPSQRSDGGEASSLGHEIMRGWSDAALFSSPKGF